MIALLTGFFASIAHVLSGPDHLAAVTPFSLNLKNKAWIVGISWGMGHTAGMLIIGAVFILFRELLPVEAISGHAELIVGIVLIFIGLWAIFRQWMPFRRPVHSHPHVHENGEVYVHIHKHDHRTTHAHQHVHAKTSRQSAIAALLVGIIHGLAGFSHLVAVLPSLAIPTVTQSVLYLTGFASGTVFTMILYTFLLGMLATKLEANRRHAVLTWVSVAGGLLALVVGIYWIFQSI